MRCDTTPPHCSPAGCGFQAHRQVCISGLHRLSDRCLDATWSSGALPRLAQPSPTRPPGSHSHPLRGTQKLTGAALLTPLHMPHPISAPVPSMLSKPAAQPVPSPSISAKERETQLTPSPFTGCPSSWTEHGGGGGGGGGSFAQGWER